MIEKLDESVVYDNPTPQNRSRHGCFPGVIRLPGGELLAAVVIGEAFDATDRTTWLTRSSDAGRTWSLQGPLQESSETPEHWSDSMKLLHLQDDRLLAMGYRFHRQHADELLVNGETDGVRPGDNITATSQDGGRTWSGLQVLLTGFQEVIELSGPPIRLDGGDLLAAGSLFPRWDGSRPSGALGPVLRSRDDGVTWDDSAVFFHDEAGRHTPAETRLCEMQPGRVVALWWMIDHRRGRSLHNHVAVSHDGGRTWSRPIDTGIPAQASSLLHWQDDLLLTVHACREGEDIGVFVNLVDFRGDRWRTLASEKVWGNARAERIGSYAEMSRNLKFGQPSLLRLDPETVLATHWTIEDGQGRVLTHRLRVHA
jgi:sialidase-1